MTAKRILVIRTDRLGDVVLSTPVLTALRQKFPHAFIAMLLRPYTAELVAGHPHVDAILCDDVENENRSFQGFLHLVKRIKEGRFDVSIVLHPSLRLAVLCWLARIPLRIGSGYRAYSFLFNRKIFQHRKNSGRHELDLNFDLLKPLGISQGPISFALAVPENARQRVHALLLEHGIADDTPYVVLHPGSGGSAMDWPSDRFAALADKIQQEQGFRVVVTGNKYEAILVDRMSTHAQKPFIRFDGRLGIKEMLALLSRAQMMVANSTGPLHMAVAMGTPVVGLFCPLQACSPLRWGPYNREDSVLMPPVPPCTACDRNRCLLGNCMELITVEQVFAKVKEKNLLS